MTKKQQKPMLEMAVRLGEFMQATPFEPFEIRTTDGDTITVIHRDFVSRSPSGETAAVFEKDGHMRLLNVRQVVTIAQARPKKGMLGQGPGKK